MLQQKVLLLLFGVTSFVGGLTCDESLPPYIDPTDVFELNQSAEYVLSTRENALKVYVNIVNRYDETFDGTTYFDGTVAITLTSDSTFKKTFFIGSPNIISGKYNTSTQRLTIDPNDTLKLLFSWDFIDETGRYIREVVHYRPDICCSQRLFTDPLTVTIHSHVKVFEKIAFVTAPTLSYTFVHYNTLVPQGVCEPLPNRPECE